jgi:hypothetical protein
VLTFGTLTRAKWGPWIMYGGTPYEHLMVPVKEGLK